MRPETKNGPRPVSARPLPRAWALGPTVNERAAETAHVRPPPGPQSARSPAGRCRPSDLIRWLPGLLAGSKPTSATGRPNPRPISSPFLHFFRPRLRSSGRHGRSVRKRRRRRRPPRRRARSPERERAAVERPDGGARARAPDPRRTQASSGPRWFCAGGGRGSGARRWPARATGKPAAFFFLVSWILGLGLGFRWVFFVDPRSIFISVTSFYFLSVDLSKMNPKNHDLQLDRRLIPMMDCILLCF